jgi:hypothetical protein
VSGHLFITPGDITQISAHALAYSASSYLGADGNLFSAFAQHVPGFGAWLASVRRGFDRPCVAGDSFWMPLDKDRAPHGVVVTVAAARGAAGEDKAATAVRAALTTAVARLRNEVGLKERLLIALPAFRVGMGGDRGQRLRSALVQVTTALEVLDGLDDVDAVFVTYTHTLYRIFLEARRKVLGAPPDAARHPALVDSLLAGECVLFVGAGLSRGAGLPDWNQLIDRLIADLKIAPGGRHDHLDLAQWYREHFGAASLANVISRTFSDATCRPLPTLAHYLLMSLPARHVITTNYDDLLERALAAVKRYPVKVAQQCDVPRTGQAGGVFVVKLHGDVSSPDEIVLSRDDYDEFFERRPAMALLLESLLLNQTFFFVGYGLRDPNFRQIFARIARMLREARRPAFATTFEAAGDSAAYLTEQWRNKQLHLLSIPGDSTAEQEREFARFLDRLADQVTMQTPRLFLAPDVAAPPRLARLRKEFVEGVGPELEAACLGDLSGPDAGPQVRYLAEVLEFLTKQGWNPGPRQGRDLCRLWERLAEHTADPLERRRLLILALECTEDFADVQRVRQQLADVEKMLR